MNLGEMGRAAARYADRYDEYVKTRGPDGEERFEGEALHWFNLFRDAVNEAYFEASRSRMTPDVRMETALDDDCMIDMTGMEPGPCSLRGVYCEDGATEMEFVFRTRMRIEVIGARPGERMILHYHYLPERLMKEADEPIFPEAQVDPMVYVSLAVARLWQSERKMSAAQPWLSEYYRRLRELRPDMRPARKRRLPRPRFR